MTERAEYLIAVVGADVTNFRRGMQDVRRELGVLDSTSENVFARVGRNMTLALTTPLTVGASFAVNAASDFEAAMRNVNSIAFLTEAQFQNLSNEIFEFGKATRGGATEAAQALYTIYSAGLTGESAMYTMRAAVAASEAGLSDITVTAEGLAAVMLAYGINTEEGAERASDALTRMVQVGVGSMQAFVGSTSTFIPAAAALGVDFAEAFGLNAMLTQLAYSPSEAAVRVNAAMRSMLKPTEAMQKAFTKLGADTTAELIAKFGGLHEALIAIRNTTDGSAEAVFELFGETRAVQGVLALTNNIETARKTLDGFMEGMDGATAAAREQQMLSFAYQWDLLSSAINATAIKIGSVLTPVLIPLMGHIQQMLIAFSSLDQSTVALGVAVAGLVAAFAPLLWLLPSIVSPLGLMTTGLVVFGQELNRVFADIDQKTGAIQTTIIDPILAIADAFRGAFNEEYKYQLSFEFDTGGEPNQVVRQGKSYIVKAGDTLWDVWQREFSEFPTFAEFVAETGLTSSTIYPDQVISLQSTIDAIGSEATTVEARIYTMNERLQRAFTAGWQALVNQAPNFARGLATIGSAMATAGSNLINQTSDWLKEVFANPMGGDSFLDRIKEPLNNFFSFEWLNDITANPDIQNLLTSLGNLFVSVRDYAIPEIARVAGFISAKLVTLLGQGISYAFEWLSGGGASDAADGLGNYAELLGYSFSDGWSQGMDGSAMSSVGESITNSLTSMLESVADSLQPSTDRGDTPIYRGLRGAFGYLFGGGLSEDVSEQDSPIIAAFLNMLNSLGTWLTTNGVPTLARSLGYVIGSVGVLVQTGISNLWALITGEGNLESAANGLGSSIITPFMEGLAEARQDLGGAGDSATEDMVGNILTGLAGAIALGAVSKFAIFGVAARGIGFGLSTALSVFTPFANIAAAVVRGGMSFMVRGFTTLMTGAWAAFSQTALGVWATGAATSLVTSLKAALVTVASGLGLAGALGTILTVPSSTQVQPRVEGEWDLPIDATVNPLIRFAEPVYDVDTDELLSGGGGFNSDTWIELNRALMTALNAGIIRQTPLDIPLNLRNFRFTITGTPEEILQAQINWDELINADSAALAKKNIYLPFSSLFSIIPDEGFSLSDYVLNENTTLEIKARYANAIRDGVLEGYNALANQSRFRTPFDPDFLAKFGVHTVTTKDNPSIPAFDKIRGMLNTYTPESDASILEVATGFAQRFQTLLGVAVEQHPLDIEAIRSGVLSPLAEVLEDGFGAGSPVSTAMFGLNTTVTKSLTGVSDTVTTESENIAGGLDVLGKGMAAPVGVVVSEFNRIRDALTEAIQKWTEFMGLGVPTAATVGGLNPPATPAPTSNNTNNTSTTVVIRDNNFSTEADINKLARAFRQNGYRI